MRSSRGVVKSGKHAATATTAKGVKITVLKLPAFTTAQENSVRALRDWEKRSETLQAAD